MGTIKRATVAFLIAGSVALNSANVAAAYDTEGLGSHHQHGGSGVLVPEETIGLPNSVSDDDHIVVCSLVGDGNCVVTTREQIDRGNFLDQVICLVTSLDNPFAGALCYSPIPLPPFGGVIIGGPSQQA